MNLLTFGFIFAILIALTGPRGVIGFIVGTVCASVILQ